MSQPSPMSRTEFADVLKKAEDILHDCWLRCPCPCDNESQCADCAKLLTVAEEVEKLHRRAAELAERT